MADANDALGSVRPGDAIDLRADSWNSMAEAARAFRSGRLDVQGGGGRGGRSGTLELLVKCPAGATLPAGSILAYGGNYLSGLLPSVEFLERPAFLGRIPSSPNDEFCVLLEDGLQYEFTRAAFGGVYYGLPILKGPGDYAQCVAGSTTTLQQSTRGKARILSIAAGSSLTDTSLLLGSPSDMTITALLTSRNGWDFAFTQVNDDPAGAGVSTGLITGTTTDGWASHRVNTTVDADLLIGATVELQRFPGGHTQSYSGGGISTGKMNWAFGPYYKVVADILPPAFGAAANAFTFTYRMVLGTPIGTAVGTRYFYAASGTAITVG